MTLAFPQMPPRRRTPFEVVAPNQGLYLGRSALEVPDRGLADCLNVRIRNRKITNRNVGHERLFNVSLGNQALLVALFRASNGVNTTVFGTKTDLFRYDEGNNRPVYITPIYNTGTISVVNGSPTVTGSGTSWSANVKAGDQIALGSASLVTAAWYTVDTVDSDTQITLTENYTTTPDLSGQTYTIRKLFTASDADFWDWDVFPDAPNGPESGLTAGDHFYATNGQELVVWDGSAAQVVVLSHSDGTGLGFSCRTLCYYKNMMLYGHITEGSAIRPSSMKNSAIADPENVTTLEANETIIAESVDFVRALRRLGDYVIGYCENSVNVVQFVDNPVYFAIRTAAPRIGVFGARAIVNFGDYHEFLAKDQAYRFDGVRLIPYANHIFDDVLQRVDRDRSEKALAAISEEDREAYWILPLSADGAGSTKSPETGWVEHYAEQVGSAPTPFTKRYLPATAIGNFLSSPNNRFSDFSGVTFDQLNQIFVSSYFSAAFPVLLMGDEDGYIYKLNTVTGFSDDEEAECFITSPTRPLVDGRSRGVVRRVEPYVDLALGGQELAVRARTQERVEGEVTEAEKQYSLDQSGQRFCSFRNPGRYVSVEFGSLLSTANTWTLEGYRVEGEAIGER